MSAVSAADRPPLERRGLDLAPAVDPTTGRPALVGYAVRFGEPSAPIGDPAFIEIVRPEALRRLPERRDVKAYVGHDDRRVPMGSSKAGTLRLQVDSVGLRFRLEPPDSPSGLDLVEGVRRGDIDGVSFGFRVVADGDVWDRTSRPPVRELRDIDLFELSFVSWPAYANAGVAIEQRALDMARRILADDGQRTRDAEIRELETRLLTLLVSGR